MLAEQITEGRSLAMRIPAGYYVVENTKPGALIPWIAQRIFDEKSLSRFWAAKKIGPYQERDEAEAMAKLKADGAPLGAKLVDSQAKWYRP